MPPYFGVLLIVDPRVLPGECFLKRWARNAKDGISSDENNSLPQDWQESITSRYGDLCHDAIRCAERGAASLEVYKAAKDVLAKAYAEIVASEKNPDSGAQRGAININEEITIDEAMNHQSLQDPERKVTNLLGQLLGSTWSPV
uniref:Uncharacterized protein n=1 Tax=Ananas comosus var. bracteatus TaxID=296719 RepID=A0A6V7NN53_ANACO|nr:unnamed protein product [Ananas comosus var. bracteatus]